MINSSNQIVAEKNWSVIAFGSKISCQNVALLENYTGSSDYFSFVVEK